MEEELHLKKIFLISMIVSLSISALVGVVIFLIGNFGEIEARILFTTISIGIYSLIGLGFSALYERRKLPLFSISGLILTILSFISVILEIWEIYPGNIWKTTLIFIILGASFLQASLILLAKSDKFIVDISIFTTIFLISVVAILLIALVLLEERVGEFYFRILGSIAILDGLGTIITPILVKVTKIPHAQQSVKVKK